MTPAVLVAHIQQMVLCSSPGVLDERNHSLESSLVDVSRDDMGTRLSLGHTKRLPMPDAAPVTRATLSLKVYIRLSIRDLCRDPQALDCRLALGHIRVHERLSVYERGEGAAFELSTSVKMVDC